MNSPAPKKHGLGNVLGSTLQNVVTGKNIGESLAESAVSELLDNAATQMAQNMIGSSAAEAAKLVNALRNGHVVRYTYYTANNWVREDDPLEQTATISKCRQHQFISLDLAKKTYRVSDTTPKGCPTTPGQPEAPAKAETATPQPGTVDLTLTSTTSNLGAKNLSGVRTTGSQGSFEMAMTNATGSCRNGDVKASFVSYVSGIKRPAAYCPLATPKYVPSAPVDIERHGGGCKPTLHVKGGASANIPGSQADLLEMYTLMTITSGGNAKQAQSNKPFSTLLERGNLAWLSQGQADPLFEIPSGFTEQK